MNEKNNTCISCVFNGFKYIYTFNKLSLKRAKSVRYPVFIIFIPIRDFPRFVTFVQRCCRHEERCTLSIQRCTTVCRKPFRRMRHLIEYERRFKIQQIATLCRFIILLNATLERICFIEHRFSENCRRA